MAFEPEIVSYNCATRLSLNDFKKLISSDDHFEQLVRETPDVEQLNYDGPFGPFVFWTCDVGNFEKAKKQMSKALNKILKP